MISDYYENRIDSLKAKERIITKQLENVQEEIRQVKHEYAEETARKGL